MRPGEEPLLGSIMFGEHREPDLYSERSAPRSGPTGPLTLVLAAAFVLVLALFGGALASIL